MAQAGGKSEDQHYVPRILLRGFLAAPKEKEQIWVFDKHENRSFRTQIRNIASERNFYELDSGSSSGKIESIFSDLESKTVGVIEQIVADQSLAGLSAEQKGWLAVFITTQSLRTKHFREILKTLSDGYRDHIASLGFDPKQVEGFFPIETEDDLKIASIAQFKDQVKSHAELLKQKVVFLSKTSIDRPFWISDHPVVMHNSQDFGPYGNIGLAVPGIEIYLPLTSTLLLGLWCPELANVIHTNLKQAQAIRNAFTEQILTGICPDPEALKVAYTECEDIIRRTEPLANALETGGVIEATDENVMFYNSQQVTWAHRFVMSPLQKFELVERMIADNPKYRVGLKPTFG